MKKEILDITEFGLTIEQFNEGFIEFRKNNPTKLETGTLLDRIFEQGIPEGNLSVMVGNSNVESKLFDYIKYLKIK